MRAHTTQPAAQGAVESVLEAGFIRGTGMAVPERVVTNADLEKIVDTTDEWIRTRSGIRERRACEEGQNTADMAALAARRALESAGVDPLDVDVLVLSTATPDHLLPSTACETQARIGAHRAAAFDISAACAGWLYGLTIAHGLIRSGAHRHVLVGVSCGGVWRTRDEGKTWDIAGTGMRAEFMPRFSITGYIAPSAPRFQDQFCTCSEVKRASARRSCMAPSCA